MAANIEQQDFVLGDLQRQGDAVAVSQADGLHALEFASQGVQVQAGFEGVGAKLRPGYRRIVGRDRLSL